MAVVGPCSQAPGEAKKILMPTLKVQNIVII
ncbi:protein of unknown function [Alcaligenes faecalis subsp. faecalis]|nr:protein of unknown function [Alcaligenes faecalis subsp. faecalis]